MTQNMLTTIRDSVLLLKNKKLIIGVSGGPDSIALLDCLCNLQEELNLICIVAHMEHGFRGQVSREDANYVREYSLKKSLIFRMKAVDMPKIIKEQGGSAQELARKERYQWFYQLAAEHETPYVVLGHHHDDQVETILMRFLRGTSVAGLAGMEQRTERKGIVIIRPMLNIYKEEILEYCRSKGIQPRVDASNEDNHYFRNKVRNCLLPQLAKEYNQNIKQALTNISELAKEDTDYFKDTVAAVTKRIVTEVICHKKYEIRRMEFINLHIALQRRILLLILYYLKTETRFEKKHIDSIICWLKVKESGGIMQLPNDVTIIREADRAILLDEPVELPLLQSKILEIGENILSNQSIIDIKIFKKEREQQYSDSEDTVFFDRGRLKGTTLYCRSRREGDRMTIFGMKGRKRIKDMLIDAKIPSRFRDQIPLITTDDAILWLAGIRRSDVAPVTVETTEIVRIQYIDNEFLRRQSCKTTF